MCYLIPIEAIIPFILQINQLDKTISPVYCLTFTYTSTCFRRPHAHHQELNNCSSNSLWFYLRSVVIAVLLVVVGPVDRTTTKSTRTHARMRARLSSWNNVTFTAILSKSTAASPVTHDKCCIPNINRRVR
jgi:hypothetical protein